MLMDWMDMTGNGTGEWVSEGRKGDARGPGPRSSTRYLILLFFSSPPGVERKLDTLRLFALSLSLFSLSLSVCCGC